MRKLLVSSIPFVLLLAGCASPESQMIGKWRGSIEESQTVKDKIKGTEAASMASAFKSMISPVLALRPDHSFTLSFAVAPIEGTWKMDKTDIILTPKTIMGMSKDEVQKQAGKELDKAKEKSPIPLPFGGVGGSLPMLSEMRAHLNEKDQTLTLDPGEGTFIGGFGKIVFTKA
jgi:hypothetical protein